MTELLLVIVDISVQPLGNYGYFWTMPEIWVFTFQRTTWRDAIAMVDVATAVHIPEFVMVDVAAAVHIPAALLANLPTKHMYSKFRFLC